MFYFILFGLIGGPYLYWKIKRTDHKRTLLSSTIFISSCTSIGLLILSVIIVNQLETPEKTRAVSKSYEQLLNDSIAQIVKQDFYFTSLDSLNNNLDYQHRLIKAFYNNKNKLDSGNRTALLKRKYETYFSSKDFELHKHGIFGLGLIDYFEDKLETSKIYLSDSLLSKFQFINFYLAKISEEKNDYDQSIIHYWNELNFKNELTLPSARVLLEKYADSKDYNTLTKLYYTVGPNRLFTYSLGRQVHLYNLNIAEYFEWCYYSVADKVKLLGAIAAICIAIIWAIYLIRLDIFNPNKLSLFLMMFILGCFTVIGVYILNDSFDIYFNWSLNGGFWNDLAFSIFGIGVPEEIVKVTPLLLIISLFKKELKEPIDYIIYASASALGFAFIENMLYFQDVTSGIVHGRAYLSAVGHMIDASIIAYGIVISRFKPDVKNKVLTIVGYFFLAVFTHGIYDFLLFQSLLLLFVIFFIFSVQVWIVIINNSLNNSSFFNYNLTKKIDHSRGFLAIALTSVIILEYFFVGFEEGPKEANVILLSSLMTGGVLVVFFTSNLSSFNFIPRFWRDIYFSSRERRGYGTLPAHSLLTSWYFLNAIRDHNYVGYRVIVKNHEYNKNLSGIIPREGISAKIIERIILNDEGDQDQHWFLLEIDDLLHFADYSQRYVLIKMRYQSQSLKYENDLDIYFKAIPNIQMLMNGDRNKEDYPSFGWVTISKT